MEANCGLVNALNACNCVRQIPVALEAGIIDRENLPLATHPQRDPAKRRKLELAADADAIQRVAQEFCCQPDFAAPPSVLDKLRTLIESKALRLLS